MKKIFAFLLAVLYLSVSSGLAVEIHHCMGEIKDFSIAVSKSNKCDSCGMEKGSNKCCKDELKFVSLQDSYKLSNINYELTVPQFDLQNNHFIVNNTAVCRIAITNAKSHSPPDHSTIPLHLLNSVFRI